MEKKKSAVYETGLLAFLAALQNNPDFRAGFQSEPTKAMEEYALTKEEQQAMVEAGNGSFSLLLKLVHEIFEKCIKIVAW